MHSNRRGLRIAALLLFVIAILPAGCKKNEEPKTPAQGNGEVKSVAPAKAVDPNATVATVNGTVIREKQVITEIQPVLDEIAKTAQQLPPAWIEQYKKQLRQRVIEKLVVKNLLDSKVKESGIVISEEQALSELTKALAELKPPVTLDDYKKKLADNKMKFEDALLEVRGALGYEKLFEPVTKNKITISDSDANSFYTAHIDEFEEPEQVRASHILISVKKTDSNEVKAKARAKIEAIMAKIKADANFAELAKTDSNDTGSAKNGGDLDFFARGEMAEPFEKAAFALKPGQLSDIVETEYGYHIIKVTDHKDARKVPLADVKEQIIKELKGKQEDALIDEYIESLKDNAKITYTAGNEPVKEPVNDAPAANGPIGIVPNK
jgi:peptidyl-prolyl cis-trans isomerase C